MVLGFCFFYLFNRILTFYALFNVKNWFISKYWIVIITLNIQHFNCNHFSHLIFYNNNHHLFLIIILIYTKLYDINYSHLIQIMFKQILLKRDGTLTGSTILGQSGSGSNENNWMTLLSSKSSEQLNDFFGRVLLLFIRCSRRFLSIKERASQCI